MVLNLNMKNADLTIPELNEVQLINYSKVIIAITGCLEHELDFAQKHRFIEGLPTYLKYFVQVDENLVMITFDRIEKQFYYTERGFRVLIPDEIFDHLINY